MKKPENLTPREREVLRLLACGCSYWQAAAVMRAMQLRLFEPLDA